MKLINAIVFDFDGVIIDSEKARYDAWQAVYSIYGHTLPMNEWIKNIGRSSYVADPYKILLQLTGITIPFETINDKAKKFETDFVAKTQLLPGVFEILAYAKKNNIKIAIASSSSREWVEGHLKRLNVHEYFSTLVCREDTLKHKPFPEPYLTAINRLGQNPENTIAIEDSPLGIDAALSAGLKCIAVGCSITKNMDLSKATLQLFSLKDIDFSRIDS